MHPPYGQIVHDLKKKKSGHDIGHPYMGKNRMCRHTIFRSYCLYYSRHVIVVTTVVTTVFTENRMTTHTIFFLIYRCSMSGTVFKKKSTFKDGSDDDDDTKVRAALPGRKEQRAKNDDKRAFLRIHNCHCDSRNISGRRGVLSRCWNPSKLRVSWDSGAHGDNTSGEMRM